MQSANHLEDQKMVTIHQFGDMSEALLAQACLESAGIESFLSDTNIARVDWPLSRGMRLQVMENDAPAAIALLQQPPADSSAQDSPAI